MTLTVPRIFLRQRSPQAAVYDDLVDRGHEVAGFKWRGQSRI
jgi:hypothetical protein